MMDKIIDRSYRAVVSTALALLGLATFMMAKSVEPQIGAVVHRDVALGLLVAGIVVAVGSTTTARRLAWAVLAVLAAPQLEERLGRILRRRARPAEAR